MALVSVIIPAYNCARYLMDALNSVFQQTYQDYEVIAVNDGSTDNTEEILRAYASRIKYIYQKNRGPSAARNAGISQARGKYIAFLDADDTWLSNKLALQVALLNNNPGLGMVGCGYYNIDQDGKIVGEEDALNYTEMRLLVRDLMVRAIPNGSSSGVVIAASCIDDVGLFDETLTGSEDRDMWLRVAKKYQVLNIVQPLIKIRIHAKNAHKNVPMIKRNKKIFIKKYTREMSLSLRKKAYAYLYLDAAREYYAANKHPEAIINIFLSIMAYPFKIYKKDDKYRLFLKLLLPDISVRVLKQCYLNLNKKQQNYHGKNNIN